MAVAIVCHVNDELRFVGTSITEEEAVHAILTHALEKYPEVKQVEEVPADAGFFLYKVSDGRYRVVHRVWKEGWVVRSLSSARPQRDYQILAVDGFLGCTYPECTHRHNPKSRRNRNRK